MIVQTKNGKVKGFENKSLAGAKKFRSFLGIPYAKPPIDDLRFAPAVPADRWEGVYDATYERSQCSQMSFGGSQGSSDVKGVEDCLFLNIHTPEVDRNALHPVLFVIHGGGFFAGSGSQDMMGADYLIEHDIVIVTFNYRLHILGFLDLQLPECSGNAGLKDQLMALKWVKENIREFGGNPENITINGSSAGGASVHMMMISPLTKGLFQKAIFQGGHSLCSCSITRDPVRWAFELGRKLGFTGDGRQDLLKFLKSVSAEALTKATQDLFISSPWAETAKFPNLFFAPTIEVIKEGAFLPDYPENLMKLATPVPCIAGYNEVEAIINFKLSQKIAENKNNPEIFLKDIIKDNYKVNDAQLREIENKIKSFYFQQGDKGRSKVEIMDDLLTDIMFLRFYDSFEFISLSNVPVYIYHFSYFIKDHFQRKLFDPQSSKKRAFHGEECILLFAPRMADPLPVPKGTDAKVQRYICRLFTNFIKMGHPSNNDLGVEWKPYTIKEPCYLQIDEQLKLENGKINEKRIEFLKNLFQDIELIIE